jgi:aryl-alcohol dehydrogenase-like predicted oxidoreductase
MKPEEEVISALQELGIGFVPFSPLGKGFLTGKIDENRTVEAGDVGNIIPCFTPEPRKVNQELLIFLEKLQKV